MRARTRLLLLALLVPSAASAQPYGFVTSAAENRIAVIDLDDDVLVRSLPLSGLPSGSALGVSHLFVARTQANSLASINTSTGATTYTAVGVSPTAVVVSPFFVFVANTGSDTVSVVNPNVAVPVVVLLIPVGRAPIALAGGLPRLYVANWGDGTVSVVDTVASGAPVVATITVGAFPAGLALDPVAGRLYVANFDDDTVSVVDTASLTVTATIPVCERPRGLATDLAGRLYVACFNDGAIDAIDTATNAVILEAPSGAPNPLDVQLGPGNERLYVVHLQVGKSITVLDAATLAPLGAIEAPAGGMTFAGYGPQAPPALTWRRRLLDWASRPLARESWVAPGASRRTATGRRQPDGTTTPFVFGVTDFEFNPPDWAVRNATGGQVATQVATSGYLSPRWRRTDHAAAGRLDHEFTPVVYDPASLGGVDRIDAGWSFKVVEAEHSVRERLVVFQGGIAYRTAVRTFSNTAWMGESNALLYEGLTATDFDDGQGSSPDFSAAGAPLTFGYHRENTGPGPVAEGIDGFRVKVHRHVPPGILSLSVEDAIFIFPPAASVGAVLRTSGSEGAVSVEVTEDCATCSLNLSLATWANGDNTSRPFVLDCPTGPPPAALGACRIQLRNPTGGALLEDFIAHFEVTSEGYSAALRDLLETIRQLIAKGLSPLWIAAFTLPAIGLALRRRRGRVQGRPSRRGTTNPADAPAREP